MAISSLFKMAFWPLVAVGGTYICCLLLLINPWLQRNAIYMHKLQLTWNSDLTKPEQFGFAKNQVASFYIPTPDGEKLFAWHVLPLALYAEHRDILLNTDSGFIEDITQSTAFQLLQSDPEARLIIHFHGNAGTVGAGYRPVYMRSLSAASPYKLHVLSIDYRGFGYSTGDPNEQGLITDGLAAVKWAIEVAGVSPDRIAILGQSLGTAVTFGVAEALLNPPNAIEEDPNKKIEVGAVISIAGFSNMKQLLETYHMGGFIPVLAPLRPYPLVLRFFTSFVYETWESSQRLHSFINKGSDKLKLYFIHAYNDMEIPWEHSNYLFYAATNATISEDRELTLQEMRETRVKQELGAEGYVNTWPAEKSGGKLIQQWVVKWGEHNRIVASSSVSLLVARALGL
ncbi:Alpha/Beta hydrolase protein [Kalaharituber pfeilii]|nr:Alpha/Beta hydrolase protein [Kalaharituber pfeilii]